MKFFKRTLCFALATLILLEMLVACGAKPKTDDEIYLTKGEFFAYFVYENSMTSSIHTPEEINQCKDGSAEADVIVEWGYLPEELAKKDLKKPVTKEIVVMVCANDAIGLTEGSVDSMKDSDMLADPQLIANAYASGFFELENGYFNGARKMTFEDCQTIMDRANECTAAFHFDENDAVLELDDDVVVVDAADLSADDFVIDWDKTEIIQEEQEETEGVAGTGFCPVSEEPTASFLDLNIGGEPTEGNIVKTDTFAPPAFGRGIVVSITKHTFENIMHSPKIGDLVVLDNGTVFLPPQMILNGYNDKTMYKLENVVMNGPLYECTFSVPDFEEAVEKSDVHSTNLKNKAGLDVTQELGEYDGWKFSIDKTGNSITLKAEKDFVVRGDTIGKNGKEMAAWRPPEKTVHATSTFKISNFNIDVDNLRSFASKKGEGFIKVQYDTDMTFDLSTSLRYSPDDNRNGKFPANWNNSRWTDAGRPGAKDIKIARFTPTNGVVGANIYIYLQIGMDGKLTWHTSVKNGGIKITTNNGNVNRKELGEKKEDISANISIYARIGVDAKLIIFGFVNVIEYDVGVDLDAQGLVDLYIADNKEKSGVFADEEGLGDYLANEKDFHYCIDVSATIGVSGKLKECAVKLILDALNSGNSLNFSLEIVSWGFHFEDGAKVDACTRGGKDKKDEELATSKDDSIELSSYKEILEPNTCKSVELSAVPSESKSFINSAKSITVESKDNSIVKASYNKKSRVITLETVGEGSTEIIIRAKKGALWWKEYVEQNISVTVLPLETV